MPATHRSLTAPALGALLLAAVPAYAQLGDGPSFARLLAQTLLSLLFVALLAVVVLRLAGRAGLGRPRTAKLEILERLPVAPRQAILAVRAHDRVLLVGQSPAGLSRLGEVAAARWTGGQPGFAALLDAAAHDDDRADDAGLAPDRLAPDASGAAPATPSTSREIVA